MTDLPRRTRSVRLVVTCLWLAAPASAQDLGPYLGFALGAQGTQADFDRGAVADTGEYRTGAGIAGFTGYRFGSGLRLEVEAGTRSAGVRNIEGSLAARDGGDTQAETLFVNALYEFRPAGQLVPYARVGIGVARLRHDLVRSVPGGSVLGEAKVIAGQAIAGARLPLKAGWSAFGDLRLMATDEGRFTAGDGDALSGAART